MPQRFLRPGITNSDRWNSVSFAAQSFYIRILTLVDDFGQYDARSSVLLGNCFSIWNVTQPKEAFNLAGVEQLLQQLAASRLVELYETNEGKRFLQVSQWQERIREGCKRKWPQNAKVAATCSNLLPSSSPPSPSPSPSPYVDCSKVQEVKTTKLKNNGHFTKPTLDEMIAEGKSISLPQIESEGCWHHYESNGWRVSRSPMKNWKSALRNWKRNFIKFGGCLNGQTQRRGQNI